jgi:hypothetical protein
VTFTFSPAHKALREQFDQTRAWLEATAQRLAGRKVTVSAQTSASGDAPPAPDVAAAPVKTAPASQPGAARDLKAEVSSTSAVQAMLEVFPAEIRDVEEM